jgi:hypothetical protein
MQNDELSTTSEEEAPTPAEKARKTRAVNLAREAAENDRLAEETGMPLHCSFSSQTRLIVHRDVAGGRQAKKNALEKKGTWHASSQA